MTRCGLTVGMEIAAYARLRGIKVANHNFTADINTAASLHFLAANPNALVLEYCTRSSSSAAASRRTRSGSGTAAYRFPTPRASGLEPDMAVIERYLVR